MIAIDKAVLAQKVKVQCCYKMADMLNLKKWLVYQKSVEMAIRAPDGAKKGRGDGGQTHV